MTPPVSTSLFLAMTARSVEARPHWLRYPFLTKGTLEGAVFMLVVK